MNTDTLRRQSLFLDRRRSSRFRISPSAPNIHYIRQKCFKNSREKKQNKCKQQKRQRHRTMLFPNAGK